MWWSSWWFILYAIVSVLWIFFAFMQWADTEMDDLKERRFAARAVLMAPVWPLVVLYGIGRLMGVLVMDAVRGRPTDELREAGLEGKVDVRTDGCCRMRRRPDRPMPWSCSFMMGDLWSQGKRVSADCSIGASALV